jgi:hypothetical protein
LEAKLRRQTANSTGKQGFMGPEIVYFWRLMEEIVGPLSENKILVAVFLLEGIPGKFNWFC